MATDLGAKNSQRRKDLYDKVISPLNAAAKKMGLVAPFGRNSWLDANATERTAKWKQVRETARDLSDLLGLDFKMATSMDTYNKAKAVSLRIVQEVNSQVGANNADAAADNAAADVPLLDDAGGGGGPVPNDPSTWGLPSVPGIPGGTSAGDLGAWGVESGGIPVEVPGVEVPGGLEGLGTAAKVGMAVGGVAVLTGAVALTVKWWRARQAAA